MTNGESECIKVALELTKGWAFLCPSPEHHPSILATMTDTPSKSRAYKKPSSIRI